MIITCFLKNYNFELNIIFNRILNKIESEIKCFNKRSKQDINTNYNIILTPSRLSNRDPKITLP